MKKVDNNFWDIAIQVSSDWEDIKEGKYVFSGFGGKAEQEAKLFAKHLGKVASGAFVDKLREELNKGRE